MSALHIVSFFAPRPDHAFFQDYTPFLALLRESCARHGVTHRVLTDDPAVAEDAYFTALPRSLMRAFVTAQFAWLSDPANAETPTLFVGADCVLGCNPTVFAEQCGDHDMVITVCDDFQDCRMNTGAIYCPRPALLASIWAEALGHVGEDWGTDQTAIYRAITRAQKRGLRVCELPVDPYNLAPEHPSDDCTRGAVIHFRGARKRWMIDYCHKHLGLGVGIQVIARPNVDAEGMLANVRACLARGLPKLAPVPAHDRHAVLIGGGASAARFLSEFAWRKTYHNQTLFALNGVSRWLQDNGIAPDYGVILDPRPGNARFVDAGVHWSAGVHWLLASQCHPDVFDAAAGQAISVWHFAAEGIEAALAPGETIVGGGLTVGLSAMGVAYALGYRQMHLYGYDSSDTDEQAHAYAQAETDVERQRVEVWHAGRRFIAGAAMYAQAEAFPRWAETLIAAGTEISVHGDGLLPSIAHTMQINAATQEHADVDAR